MYYYLFMIIISFEEENLPNSNSNIDKIDLKVMLYDLNKLSYEAKSACSKRIKG